MSKLAKLLEELCPEGVQYEPLWSLTIWDKKFNGVSREKQTKVISYKYYLSSEFNKVERENGEILYIATGISRERRYTTEELAKEYLAEGEIVCIPWGGTPNVKYYKGKFVTGDNRIATSLDINKLNNKFLYYWMQSKIDVISSFYRGSGIKHPNMKAVLDLKCPVPPIEVQCEIVRILDNFSEFSTKLSEQLSAELEGRQKQYEYYKRDILVLSSKIGEFNKLGDCCEILDSKREPIKKSKRIKGEYPYYGANGIQDYVSDYLFDGRYVLVGADGSVVNRNGTPITTWAEGKIWVNNHAHIIKETEGVLLRYLYYYIQIINITNLIRGNIPKLNQRDFRNLLIFVPPLEVQKRVVNILDKFEKIYNDILDSLSVEIQARQKQYEHYRDKLLTFKELKSNE